MSYFYFHAIDNLISVGKIEIKTILSITITKMQITFFKNERWSNCVQDKTARGNKFFCTYLSNIGMSYHNIYIFSKETVYVLL